MPSVGPELAVRLSAQGVQDVVNAFARVRQEGKKTGSEVSGFFGPLKGQLQSLTGLLPALSAGLAAVKLGGLVLEARETSENIGKLSEKTGASVGTLSALALSAHDSEVSLDDLGKGMVKLAKAQASAAQGGKEQQRAFAAVGVSIDDIRNKNPGDLFVQVAQKMASLPPGADRTAVALKLFGKAGAELIPMLDALGADGFDQAVEKAKRLGLFLDDDMVNSSRAAQDALHELEDVAAGLATQFNAGFMPEVTAGVEVLAQEVSGHGVNAMQTFGAQVGKTFAYFVEGVTVAKNFILEFFEIVRARGENAWSTLKAIGEAARHPFTQGFSGNAQAELVAAGEKMDRQLKLARQKRMSNNDYAAFELQQAQAENRKRSPNSYPRGKGADGDGGDEETRKKAQDEAAKRAKSYSDLLQARADNEIAIQRAANQVVEADDKRKYDAGLLTLEQYYNRRASRIADAADAEYKALQDKERAASNLPGTTPEERNKRDQDLEKIHTAQVELQIKREGDLAAVQDEREKARKDAADKQVADEQRLATMSGDRATASRLALQQELQQYKELLTKQGKSADEIARATDAYRTQAQARIDFGENQERGSVALGGLNLDVQGVGTQQGSGAISQIAATARIIELQRAQLPLLREIGEEMLANALAAGDPKITEQALAYNAQLDAMAAGLQNVRSAATELTDQLTTQGYQGVVDFFADGISGAKSFGDAMGDLASTFEKMVGRMVAQLLTFYLLETIVGFIAPQSNFAKSLKAKGPFGSGFAEGGWTGGSAGRPAGIVHGQEFVVKAGPATQHRAALEAMNAGLSPARVATSADYATPMPGSDGGTTLQVPPPTVIIHNNSGQPATTQQSKGSDGGDILEVLIGKMATDVARGGKLGKTMQSTFGLTRRGTVTG